MNTVLLAALSGLIAASAPAADNGLKITYVCNEGYLLEHGGKKVLIDALFSGADKPYADFPSPELVRALEQAEPPFDNIDLALATHSHDDHFLAETVALHMSHDARTVFLSTRDSVEAVRWLAPNLSRRIRAVSPGKLGGARRQNVVGIQVEALRVTHGKSDLENLAFALRWSGAAVLHTGDSGVENYRSFHGDNAGFDVIFASPGYFQTPGPGLDLVRNVIKARNVVPMHYKLLPAHLDAMRQLSGELRPQFQSVIVFTAPLQSAVIRPANPR